MNELEEIQRLLALQRADAGSLAAVPVVRAQHTRARLDSAHVSELMLRARAIYGADDRAEALDAPSPASAAICVLVRSDRLARIDGGARFDALSFGAKYHLCSAERFRDQPCLGHGTGFLIAPSVVVTAGHVIDGIPIDEIRVLFDYEVRGGALRAERMDSEIYAIRSVRHRVIDSSLDIDFAVIELDRAVPGVEPLSLRSTPATIGEPVYVIGHPVGLPKKIARGARVLGRPSEHSFLANLDAFGGNSGSPVLDLHDQVSGILVAGSEDFVWQGDCVVATTFPIDGPGEKVCCVSAWAARAR